MLCGSLEQGAMCILPAAAQVPMLLLRNMRRGNPWVKIDLCTGKLVETGGD
jgi:hypothetical protein